jgi:hypothetical protein
MTNINLYATLAEFKAYATARGQQSNITIDAADDAVIDEILSGVSRYFDDECHRTFYPRFETRYFSVPVYTNSPRKLFLDDDLLQETSIINGDTTDISALTDSLGHKVYNLLPKNYEPKFCIELVGPTYIFWIFNSIGSIQYVISVTGWWGFHNHYTQRGWTKVDTLKNAITDTTTLAFTVNTSGSVLADQILKIDNEIFNVASESTGTVTPNQRGDNGSTAATHLVGASVYAWNVQPEIKLAVMEAALNIYQARSGQSNGGKVSVTAAGIVIRPEEIPAHAQSTIVAFTRSIL